MINQLVANIKKTGAPIVVGLDPMLNYIPEQVQKKAFAEYGETLEGAAEAIWQFNKEIVDKTYDLIPAVKPQIAMYEQFGLPGLAAFKKTVDYCKEKGLVVIGDIKRGDIGSTSAAYAVGHIGKVKVGSKTYAPFDEDFVTMNPADKFDVYTVYGGLTSNANLSLYLDLPDKYTNSAVLKLLDPIVEKLYGKTFTQMMNDGMTVGELRQLLNTQELLDLLEKLHIDTGTFGQILTIINKMPSVADSVRVSFGTPNHAGLYTVTAVTDSKNYETGVGIGTLLVKMRSKGVKLNWNERFVNGKITAEEAKNFDFKATLSADGDVTIAQDNVHYLYSGFTSKWKIYSSTTTPPTEPGSYVMTVVTLGGNYQAAPITRGFKITK